MDRLVEWQPAQTTEFIQKCSPSSITCVTHNHDSTTLQVGAIAIVVLAAARLWIA
jgi:hypothetical protein